MAGMEPGEVIRLRREELGWSQQELGKRVGVSQVAIKKIEAGTTQKSKFLPKVAEVLGLNLSDLDKSLVHGAGATYRSIDARIAEVLAKVPVPVKESWLQIMLNSLPPEGRAKQPPSTLVKRPSKRR